MKVLHQPIKLRRLKRLSRPCKLQKRKVRNCRVLLTRYALDSAVKLYRFTGIKRVAIYTDSDFLIMSMDKYIFKWLRNDWLKVNGDTVVHRQRFRKLLRLMEDLTVKWVRLLL